MPVRTRFLAVALTLVVSGCANNDVVLKKQMETDAKLEQLVQGNTAANARLAELATEIALLRGQIRANASAIAELKPEVSGMRASLDSVSGRASSGTAGGAVPRIEVVNREPSPADRESAAQNAYMKAFGLYTANNYSGAVEAFDSFMTSYPDSEYAGNAMYWIGECYYTQQDYRQALTAFKRVLSDYPKGKKVPDAMLKIGFSYIGLNEQAMAKASLQSLVDRYPNSQAAAKARERLSHY